MIKKNCECKMESSNQPTEGKYQKLATEYSKLRAQASVLRRAVLDEQSKNNSLREQLRQRESALRRSEQEVDSLGFRNKQLEHRVSALQDEVAAREGRSKREKDERKHQMGKGDALQTSGSTVLVGLSDSGDIVQEAIIFEELQKKIIENAQLTSLVDDKDRELLLHIERVTNLEQILEKRANEFTEAEKRFRRDIEALLNRNCELETKLVEAASMLGSEDALSVSGSDHIPLHVTSHQNHLITPTPSHVASTEERIACLENEIVHWRTKYEIAKMNATFCSTRTGKENTNEILQNASVGPPVVIAAAVHECSSCSCSSTAAGLTVIPSLTENKSARDSLKESQVPPTTEQLIYNNFSRKFEDLLKGKCFAESRVRTFEVELEHLQICLENATYELKAKDEQIQSINQALHMLEEDLATTRVNYEEQITVLTEQVINISEQLAACK